MNGFLFDTSILSAFAPDRPAVSKELQRWTLEQGAKDTLFVSSIVVVEIQRGVAKLKRSGSVAKVSRLEFWLENLLAQFDRRVLPVGAEIARRAGDLEDAAIARGRNPGLADILIAATATLHGLVVLTANARHFSLLDVEHLNPLIDPLPDY